MAYYLEIAIMDLISFPRKTTYRRPFRKMGVCLS